MEWEPAPPVVTSEHASSRKTASKVVVIVLASVGFFVLVCGCLLAALYALLPADLLAIKGKTISELRFGGIFIAGALSLPGIILLVVAFVLWFFLWRKH
jgi:hypothetical protein